MSLSRLSLFAAARSAGPRRLFAQQLRSMSMISLEGQEEIEKFRIINEHSILMFTASWYDILVCYPSLAREIQSVICFERKMANLCFILPNLYVRCPPCKVIKPIYENLSKEHTEVAFGLVDVDENSDAALEFEISAVPTFVFFKGQTAVDKMPGADATKLEKLVKDLKSR